MGFAGLALLLCTRALSETEGDALLVICYACSVERYVVSRLFLAGCVARSVLGSLRVRKAAFSRMAMQKTTLV